MIEKLYTVEEVAELASVTGRTIRNYLKSGRLVGRKIGGQWRFPESEVQRLLSGTDDEPGVTVQSTAAAAAPSAQPVVTAPAEAADEMDFSLPVYSEDPAPQPTEATPVVSQVPAGQAAPQPVFFGSAPATQEAAVPNHSSPAHQPAAPVAENHFAPLPESYPPPPPQTPAATPLTQPNYYKDLAELPVTQPFSQPAAPATASPVIHAQPPVASAAPQTVNSAAITEQNYYAAPVHHQPPVNAAPVNPVATPAPVNQQAPEAQPAAPAKTQQPVQPQPVQAPVSAAEVQPTPASDTPPATEDPFAFLSAVGKKAAVFSSQIHANKPQGQVCSVIDLEQSLSIAKSTIDSLYQTIQTEKANDPDCDVFLEYDDRFSIARYTLFGTIAFLEKCLKIINNQ